MKVDIDKYQEMVTKVKTYKSEEAPFYLLSKLLEESGELSKEVRKLEECTQDLTVDLSSEIGDVLWCITAIAQEYGISMSKVVDSNIKKLKERDLI